MNYLIVIPKLTQKSEQSYSFPSEIAYASSSLKETGRNVITLNLNYKDKSMYEILKNIIEENDIDVLATGGLIAQYCSLKEIFNTAKRIKSDIVTILGGGVITSEAESAMEELEIADYGIIGEGEITICELADAIEGKKSIYEVDGIIFKEKNSWVITNQRKEIEDLYLRTYSDFELVDNKFMSKIMFDNDVMRFSNELIDSIVSKNKKWICFGAGRYFSEFINEYCVNKKILPLPSYVCDNNSNLHGKKVCSVEVFSPKKLDEEKVDECIIVISTVLPLMIMNELQQDLQKHYYLTVPLSQMEMNLYYSEHKENFLKVYNMLEDYESKYYYKEYIRCLLNGQCSFTSLYTANAYWDNDVVPKLKDNQVVVYAGAYDGKHIDRAIKSNPKAIVHGFEPNKPFAERLCEKYKELNNVYIHNCALYNKHDVLDFDPSVELGAMVVDKKKLNGDAPRKLAELTTVRASLLDDEIEGRVDLIALDIEGAEVLALEGAEKIIKKYSPTLAICVYHKLEHYIEIPLKIKNINPKYKLYFRQHSVAAHESVIYALVGENNE